MKPTKHPRRYSVHKIFGKTVQGEGGMTGTVCHFIRLSGCNMWDGRPETRAESGCPFCDTDFFSHTLMTVDEILKALRDLGRVEWVTISGGEPSMQVDQYLIDNLHVSGYLVAIETNGTRLLKANNIDHVTVSPKLPINQTVIKKCHSIKLLYPHPNPLITPEQYESIDCHTRYLQPIDSEDPVKNKKNIQDTLSKLYELKYWKLSLQTHKLIGVE